MRVIVELTVMAAICSRTGERDLAIGRVAGLQTQGSRANWHPGPAFAHFKEDV